ncbi:MAG: tRNA 2-thiouridine(34) synthase MnmA, partial [Candidatus Omnitrophota bacterium]|nr:tRNA 2-thiouridine(34) synthase MnmA [Candidatus Omnitrophota bacterium]
MKTVKYKKRVVVAMSGGVDSSVAAALLKKQGYEVIGITMCFNVPGENRKRPSCCGLEGIEDAKRVAGKLDIPHYVLNFGKILEERIIRDFCYEYLQGRTPNPCVRCNRYLKFGALFKKAKELNADYLATGHYARVVFDKKSRQYLLRKGKDKQKEQSYFLYSIPKKVLPYVLMPLGDFTKEKIREIAREFNLPVAEKPGSQEICFVDSDYREFLKQQLPRMLGLPIHKNMQAGPIKDQAGRIIGQHQGVAFYTIGQRERLKMALGYPAYIIKIDAKSNSLIVGKEEDVFSTGLVAKDLNFLNINFPVKTIEVKAKIRYNHREVLSRLIPLNKNKMKAIFAKPQKAVTPGQSVVFYKNDIVLGGGV